MRTAHFMLTGLLLFACKSDIDNKPAAKVSDARAGDSKPLAVAPGGPALDKAASTIGFVGSKLSDDHEGNFADFSAVIGLEGEAVTALQITVNMTSVAVEPAKLADHLRSKDFFEVETFPTATFTSTAISKAAAPATHTIEGTLDLHGTTKGISFPATIALDASSAKGKAEFTINRKDFGIVYPGMPDDLIKDEVLLKIDLAFKRS